MTDAEIFAAICANFPFDTATLDSLHQQLDALLDKTQTLGGRDGTIGEVDWKRLRALTWAMRDLAAVMRLIEEGGDPDDLIPF